MFSYARRLFTVLMVLGLTAAACGSDSDSSEAVPDEPATTSDGDVTTTSVDGADDTSPDTEGSLEQLVIAIGGDEGSLNPYTYVTGYPGFNLLGLLHDSLLGLDGTNTPQPQLATDWSTSDDGLVWTLNLRDDVSWHDGERFDADDVVFTFQYVVDNAHPRWTAGVAAVESVVATSPTSVEITLSQPNADFAVRPLADMPMLAEHVWSNEADPQNSGTDVNIGTGPYSLVSYEADQSYTFAANPDYAMGTPVAQTVVLAIIPEPATAFAALRAGEVDMVSSIVEPQLVAEFEADDDLAVTSGPGFAATMLNMNDERAPFDNPDVRRAIGLAIDPQALIDTVLLGSGTAPNPGFLHPDGPLSTAPSADVYDPEAASALLDEVGAALNADGVRELDGAPFSFELLVYADNPSRIRTAELISEQLAAVGIDAQVTPLEAETVDEQVWPGFDVNNGRDYDLAMWGWSAPIQLDAARFGALLHSDPSIGTLNVTGLADPDVDALVDRVNAAASFEERGALIGELETLVGDTRPFVMLFYQDGAYAYRSSTFDGWTYQNGQGPLSKLSLVATS